jgi:hypothetical protein
MMQRGVGRALPAAFGGTGFQPVLVHRQDAVSPRTFQEQLIKEQPE